MLDENTSRRDSSANDTSRQVRRDISVSKLTLWLNSREENGGWDCVSDKCRFWWVTWVPSYCLRWDRYCFCIDVDIFRCWYGHFSKMFLRVDFYMFKEQHKRNEYDIFMGERTFLVIYRLVWTLQQPVLCILYVFLLKKWVIYFYVRANIFWFYTLFSLDISVI